MATDLHGRRVLAIVTNYGVEQDELVVPLEHLRDAGALVTVAAETGDEIVTLVGDKNPGRRLTPDTTLDAVDTTGYGLLLVPGGTINADTLRLNERAVDIVTEFVSSKRPIAAICHGPWTLVEADALRGKQLTSYGSLKTDVINAGGSWIDQSVVRDDNHNWTLITSRDPDDLPDFLHQIDVVLADHAPAEQPVY
ncbi:type 1 glutamine amidotransferase domain-containing protein [Frondihabitans cladoniiphilus]|uniref:Type 1 glutamine amidotransferase domain-containing protein n=1 Tax=Frondihabitans cladoniiphilus TaxID=715785 RepID=A0ABP8VUL7_9MICO